MACAKQEVPHSSLTTPCRCQPPYLLQSQTLDLQLTAFNISPRWTVAYIWGLNFAHRCLCLGTLAYICRCQLYLLQSQTRDYCIQYFTTVYLGTVAYVWVLLLIFGYCCLYLDSVAYIWALLLMFGYCCIYLGTAAYNWALNWIYLQVPALSPTEPNTRLMATLHQILHHSILHLHSLQGTSLKSNV